MNSFRSYVLTPDRVSGEEYSTIERKVGRARKEKEDWELKPEEEATNKKKKTGRKQGRKLKEKQLRKRKETEVKDRKKKWQVLVAPPPGYLERAVVVVREGGVGAVVGEKSAFHSHTYVHTHTHNPHHSTRKQTGILCLH